MKKRILLFLLAILMTVSVLTGCNNNNETPEEETSGKEINTDPTEQYDENGYLIDDLPNDINYGGKQVNIYAWKNVDNEFDPGEEATDNVSYKLFCRNASVEDRFGVSLQFNQVVCDYNSQGDWTSNVQRLLLSGSEELDLLAGYSMTMMTLARDGNLEDLMQCNYLDFSKPWYPETLVNQVSINGKLFGVSGDISLSYYASLWFILMNKEMFTNYQLPGNPVQDVRDGTWTLDKMLEYAKNVYRDTNGNGKDTADEYGFVVDTVGIDEFISGSCMNFVMTDENGTFKVGSDIENPVRGQDLIEKLRRAIHQESSGIFSDDSDEYKNMVINGNVLFYTTTISALGRFRSSGLDYEYSILPSPKYDEYQKNYSTNLGFTYSMWMIPKSGKDTDLPALLIEALSSEGYRQVIPEYYDQKVKYRYADNPDNSEMFDLIRNTAWFEQSRFLYKVLEDRSMNPISTLRNCVIKQTEWTSKIAGIRQKLAYFLRDDISNIFGN